MKSILYIGNKLSHHGFSPSVIETLGEQLEEAGYEVCYAGTFKNQILRFLQMMFKVLTTGRRVDYILIDTYSTSAFWYAYFTGWLAKTIGAEYIPILHGGDLPLRLTRSKHACDSLFTNSYKNIAVSRYLQNVFENHGYPALLIPNNIDISAYPFKCREQPSPNILWVRAFSKIYNPNMAVEVLLELQKYYPKAILCMVGPEKDGSMAEFITYAERKNVRDSIEIKGRLSKGEWIKLSADYDFFINTTNIDNTPVSIIEAMSLGMLIVSTDAGGLPYLLENGQDALLVPVGNHELMAEAIRKLLNDLALCNTLSRNARKKAEGFAWEIIRESWNDLLIN